MAKGEDHKLLSEGVTAGLVRAITRNGTRGTCSCGFMMPVYPGRYPSACPLCGEPRESYPASTAPEEPPVPDDGDADDDEE